MYQPEILSRAFGAIKGAVVAATVSLLTLFATDASAVSDNVRLVYANPYQDNWSNFTDVYVHVKNLGAPGARHVHLHHAHGGSWVDTPLTLVKNDGDHSLYYVAHQPAQLEFVVKYEVDWVGTYWDNNDGANYKVQPYPGSGSFVPGQVGYNIGLLQAQVTNEPDNSALVTVDVAVQNLSYNKRVGVRFSLNGGSSWQDVDCAYQSAKSTGTGTGLIEHWRVLIGHQPRSATPMRFALYYKNLDGNVEYWDNNFNQDYSLPLASNGYIR